jgi:hypothetical protein
MLDGVAAEAEREQLGAGNDAVLASREGPDRVARSLNA